MPNKKKAKTIRKRSAQPGRTARTPRSRAQTVRRVLISIAILAAVVATVFLLVLRNESQISIAENGIGSFLSPIQNAFSTVTGSIRDFFTNWRNYDALEEENAQLARENQQLSLELDSAAEALAENERLRELLGAQDLYESLDPIYAKVIARDAGQWFTTFSINRGTSSGVSTGMAVVNGDGLIGRVYEVGLNYAKVLTIIDPRSSLGCLVQRTRDNGILRGGVSDSDDTAECYIYYLPNVNNIMPGDTIVTSGTDELYPQGITVGTVSEVSLSAGSEGNYAIVTPAVDFLHIEEVLVLRDVVETDSDTTSQNLPTLPTPSPAPTATPSPTPEAGAATPLPDTTEDIWSYPSADTSGAQDGSPTSAPLETLPEDEWAEN